MRSNSRRRSASLRIGSSPKIRSAIRPLVETLERRTLLTATPVAWYRFDEGAGATAADASGNGNTATLVGDASWQSQAVGFTTGTAGADLHFGGAGSADLGNPSDLNFSGQMTISAWFKPTSTTGTQDIIAHGYGSGPSGPYAEVYMRIYNGEYAVGSCDGGWNYQAVMPMPASDLNTWVNLTGVYDGYGWVLYRNGLQVDDQPETLGSMMVNADWRIGSSAVASDPRYFTGDVDEVKIFNQALYGQDILDQMGYQFPTLHASAAAPPVEGAATTLNLSATYASGVPNTVSSWTVDWGDGTAASPDVQSVSGQSPSPTHTYGLAGNYVVQVTATDAQGIHLLNAAQLDTSFGVGGVGTVPSGGWLPSSIITQEGFGSPAQEFYLAAGSLYGNFGIARFNTNGILDPNFGIGGVATISLAGYQLTGETAVIDDQNRILLAGYATPVGGGMDQFAVARFNFDGTPDTTFGANGLATLGAASDDDFAFAVYPYIDDNGDEKILLGGRTNRQGALVQFNDDGTPDTTFGSVGAIVPGGTMHTIYNLYRLANGQFLGGGFSWGVNGTTDYAVARYNADGSLDTTFGVDGVASTSFYDMDIATTMSIGPEGQILLTGYAQLVEGSANADMAMAVFTPDGQPDDSFGTNGRVDEYWGPIGYIYGGQYQPDGKIIVTGMDNGDVAMQRFNADGTIDPTFNGGALGTTWLGGWYYGDQVLIDSSGQAITLGYAGDPLDSWVLTRRLADVAMNVSPAVPTLSASPNSASQIDLFWHNHSPELSTIEIERSADGGNTWETVNTIAAASPIPYTDTGLQSGTGYWYRLHLTYQLGSTIESFYSNRSFASTALLPPTGLEVDQVGASHVTLSWQAATGATNYPIYRRGPQDQNFVLVGSSNTTSFTDTNLSFQTQYFYEVGDNGPAGSTSPSGEVSATTLQAAPAPENFHATSLNGQAVLQWDDNSPGITGFAIQRSGDGQSWFTLTTTGPDAATYTDGSVVNGIYYYRIYAILGEDNSAATSATPVTVYSLPSLINAAAAAQSLVTGTADTLSVLGAINGGSESSLIYTWSATPSSSATFSSNGSNAAKNTAVTFTAAGSYTFTVTIANGTSSITSSVAVVVGQPLTTIKLTPNTAALPPGATQQFTAEADDQFGAPLSNSPDFSWSVPTGGGTVDQAGLFSASSQGGPATVKASAGAVSGAASVMVYAIPTLAAPAAAAESTVTGTTDALSVLGALDGGSETSLIYTWETTSGPSATFSENDSNAAKNTTVTFTAAGTYDFKATIANGISSITSSVTVTVQQTPTIHLAPSTATLLPGATQQFSATAVDQFGAAMEDSPQFVWSVVAGGGTVDQTGLFTAPSKAGQATVQGSADGAEAQATVSIEQNYYQVTLTGRAYEPGYDASKSSGDLTVTNTDWIAAPSPEDAVRQAVSGTITLNTQYDDGSASRTFPDDLNRSDGYGFAILGSDNEWAANQLTWDPTNAQYTGAIGMWDGDSRAPRDYDFYWNVTVKQKVQVSLTAYRTGGDFGQQVAPDVQASNDPSQYIVLVNDNYDQNLSSGLPDDSASTAPITADQMQQNANGDPLDPDFGRVTLSLMPNGLKSGTVTLTLSDLSAVQLFKSDGTKLNGLTLNLSSPSGDLAPLASGPMDIWFEGLKADPDFSFKLTYTDSSGNQVSEDEVHVDLVDWTYVDMNGSQITSATPMWKDSLIAAATAPDGPLLDPTGLDGEGSDASSDFFRASLLGLSADAAPQFEVASDDVSTDVYDEQLVSATDDSGGLEQKNPTVLYNGDMYLSTDDTPLSDDQRSQVQNNLMLDAVHNDGAKETLKTAHDVQARGLPRASFIQIILNKDVCNVGDVISGVAVAASGDSSWIIKVQTSSGQTFTGSGANVLFSFTATTAGYLTVSAVGGPATAPGGVPNPPNPALPFSNGALIDVLPAGQTLPTWTQKAWDALHVSGIVPADPVARNRRITELYTTLFDSAVDPNAPNKLNPYEWYGIAAFVSNNAGNNMGAAFTYGFLPHPGAPDPQKVYQGLGQGNLAIFMDVYGQGLAYQAGGIAKINDMATANLIKPAQQQGWQLIDNGIAQQDQSLIWSGVGDLANVEQTVTLQGVINTDYAFWSSISTSWTTRTSWLFPLKSGVPGDTSDFNTWCSNNPAIVGNSYNFALGPDRYQWFVYAILPKWQTWRASHNSIDLQTLLKGGY